MRLQWHVVMALCVGYGTVLGGCAFNDALVSPMYTVEPGKKSPLSTITPLAVAIEVEDQRTQYVDRVGTKKNGYGMETAKVVTDKAPTLILHDAMKAEFEANNHKVVGPEGAQADVRLKIALKRYWSDLVIHFFDVEMLATLETDVGIFKASGQDPLTAKPLNSTFRESRQFAGDGAFEDVLRGALSDYVRSFSRDPGVLDALRSAASLKNKN